MRFAALDLRDAATLLELHALLQDAYAVEAELVGARLPVQDESLDALGASRIEFTGARERESERLIGALGVVREPGVIDIHRLAVHPGRFREGVASALLEQLDPGVPAVVATAAANAPARALYTRHGFYVLGERDTPEGIRIVELRRA